MKIILFVFAAFFTLVGFTQTPTFPTSGDIYQGLKKLNVLGSVLYIAAHPDDENTRLLTYLAKDKLYRTGYLSLTRGDGGQNLIGEEQGIELGMIRTQELLAARRLDGAEQFFSRAFDFGYSKSPQETFTKWDRDKILGDVVWVIRKFQPDVLITRFPTTGEGGHGQHTASAILANEAFTAAADPKRFPEQLKYVKLWQAKRILWNTFNFGGNNTTNPDQFKIDAGGYNPVLGKSYGEIAAESRSLHKSQGFGVPRGRGEAIEFFKTTGGDAPTADLHDGVNTTWAKAVSGAVLNEVQARVNDLVKNYDFSAPQKSVPQLVKLYALLNRQPEENNWLAQKKREVKELIAAASGLWMEAYTTTGYVAQGDSLPVSIALNNRLGQTIRLKNLKGGVAGNEMDQSFDSVLQQNRNFLFTQKIRIAPDAPLTQPYWLKEKMSQGYYNVSNPLLIGKPDVQPAATVNVLLAIEGETVSFDNIPVRYKFNDQVRGERYEPLVILPPYTVKVPKAVNILRQNEPAVQDFAYTAQRAVDSLRIYGKNQLLVKDGQLQKGASRFYTAAMPLASPRSTKSVESVTMTVPYFTESQTTTAKTLHAIRYEHIPHINYFTDAVNRYILLDVKTAGKKIGYIVGAGDKVPEALAQLGYEVTLLTEKELEQNNLQQFDAIMAGVRAFNANDWMGKYYDKLMKYVENGGNYIVQYSQSNNLRGKIGPYPFTVANKRITDESAAVIFAAPQHPVLNYPNKITQDDFEGWIQERSLYHADNLDNRYQTIFRMNDPGEQPHEGSMIIAKYGKGFFTYTGMAFFRELPAGVPGAYRLMANLIALNQTKGM